jgi:hypothetical protein
MTRIFVLALGLMAAPLAALAAPTVGDVVGTDPAAATAALAKVGCTVTNFEAEGGKVEALCTDADQKKWDVTIDPATGAITDLKSSDD